MYYAVSLSHHRRARGIQTADDRTGIYTGANQVSHVHTFVIPAPWEADPLGTCACGVSKMHQNEITTKYNNARTQASQKRGARAGADWNIAHKKSIPKLSRSKLIKMYAPKRAPSDHCRKGYHRMVDENCEYRLRRDNKVERYCLTCRRESSAVAARRRR